MSGYRERILDESGDPRGYRIVTYGDGKTEISIPTINSRGQLVWKELTFPTPPIKENYVS